MIDHALRDHLVVLLCEGQAHATLEKILEGLAPERRSTRPRTDLPSVWEVFEHLRIAQLDILHIDASHVEEDALGDWRMYRPLVRSGGMIILHDAFKTSASDKKGDAVKEAIDILKVEEGRKVVRWRWIQQMRDNNSAGPGICVAEIS